MKGDCSSTKMGLYVGSESDGEVFQSPTKVDLVKPAFNLRDVTAVMVESLEKSTTLRKVEESVDALAKITPSLKVEVVEHKNQPAGIRQDVDMLDLQVKAVVDNQGWQGAGGSEIVQSCLQELHEQQIRKKNFLIHGLAEGEINEENQKLVAVNCTRSSYEV